MYVTTAVETRTGFSKESVIEFSQLRNEPQWLRDWRLAAFATYESLPFPARTDEEWRRTDLRALKLDRFAPWAGIGETVTSLEGVVTAESAGTSQAGIIVQRDAATIYNHVENLPEGVIFTDLTTAVEKHPELVQKYLMTQAVPVNFGKFEALHAAFWQGGTFLYVPRGKSVELPLRAFAISNTAGAALFNHTLIVLEDTAEAFLVDAYQGETKEIASYTSGVVELILGKASTLRYVQLQDYGRHIWNFMTERAILGRDATLNSLHVTLGSKWTKNSIGAQLQGENSLAEMLGVFFGDSDQYFDHHTWQLHESPYATSDLEFKGALRDSARSVYSGLIKVSEGAQKTDAYQQNRNLLLSRDARADSIPNLEIKANDVRCTHGATISQVVPEHVFYLQARGIPKTEAQKLIVEGFFRPVIDRIPDEDIQNFLEGAIARKVGL